MDDKVLPGMNKDPEKMSREIRLAADAGAPVLEFEFIDRLEQLEHLVLTHVILPTKLCQKLFVFTG